MPENRLEQLSSIIATKTKQISDYLAARNLPLPSFDVNGPSELPVPTDDEDLQKIRRDLINATQELHDLAVGPADSVRYLTWGHNNTLSLQAVYHFSIAKLIPINGEASYSSLASSTGLSEFDIRRLLRHAMTNRIFYEPRSGHVAHTRASRLLAEDQPLQDWVGLHTEDLFKASGSTIDALIKYPGSQKPNQTGFNLGEPTEDICFVQFSKNPQRVRRFGGAMASYASGEGFEVSYLVDNYPWKSFGNGTVVDLGGSTGFVSIEIARKFPNLNFVVQDLPKMVVDAEANIPSDVSSRVKFMGHDFFTEQPVKDADVYLFRWIFHNWSDEYSIKILRSLIPALKTGARILVNDNVLPEPNAIDPWDEKIIRTMDLVMMSVINAREREEQDWAELFRHADPRFKFLGVTKPPKCRMYQIEAVWEGQTA